jgi:hypothetical protein
MGKAPPGSWRSVNGSHAVRIHRKTNLKLAIAPRLNVSRTSWQLCYMSNGHGYQYVKKAAATTHHSVVNRYRILAEI